MVTASDSNFFPLVPHSTRVSLSESWMAGFASACPENVTLMS